METDWSLDKLIGSLISTPIYVEDSIWGVLCGFTEVPRHFSDEEISAIEAVAQLAGTIVGRVSLKDRLDHLFLNAAALSHDARNALLPISLAVRALQSKHSNHLSEGMLEYLDVIDSASKTTGDILQSWRNSFEEISSSFGSCDLLKELSSVITQFGIQAEGRNIKLQLKGTTVYLEEGKKEIRIKVPSSDLRRVIQGYVSNAIKYCRETVRVELIHKGETGEAGFRVEDDGDGISPEYRDRVFDSFFQLPHSHSGEGMGLAGVRFTVERNGGRYGVSESPEGGASFWAVFPKAL